MQSLLRALVLAPVMCAAACSSNFHSIYRKTQVDPNKISVTLIDAKQRAILQSQEKFCAEQSPDVFSVIAQSTSGNAALGKSSDTNTLDAQVTLAYASAEQGATISRTQTINMLRELMYRTCERYLSGAISDLEMPIQAVRDQRMMVSILAIEQLTGAIRPTVISIGATANGSAGATDADVILTLNKAFDAKASADKDVASKQAAYKKLNVGSPNCDDMIKAAATDGPAPADPARLKSCQDAASATTDALKVQADAVDRLNALRDAGGNAGGSAAASSQTTSSIKNGASDKPAVATVASTVKAIVKLNYEQDELLLLCLKILSPVSKNTGRSAIDLEDPDAMHQRCEAYLKTSVDLQMRVNERAITRFQIEDTAIRVQFNRFWKKSSAAKVAAINNLLKLQPGDAVALDNLSGQTDEEEAYNSFRTLDVNTKATLSQ